MSSKIRVLTENTINKIAAGEVIENPASVIKELIENSLDAGASEIITEIKGGGRHLIRVTDNGCGMIADDALLCLERHATSKIQQVEDIHSITTMGFRGEAIPSIAAISKFTLLTAPQQTPTQKTTPSQAELENFQPDATMVIVEGGKILKCCSAARSPGTTIEVKSLFFNVPVRKKFQRSPQFDTDEVFKVISTAALAHPLVKFELINDHVNLLTTPFCHVSLDEALSRRISAILGGGFTKETVFIDIQNEDYHLLGTIGLPSHNRHNRSGQYLFINHRPVYVHSIACAIREGYGTFLPTNRHPMFVLHLNMDGALVDVNVHPQKREVRLRQEVRLREFIFKSIDSTLQRTGTVIHSELHVEPLSPSLHPLPWDLNKYEVRNIEDQMLPHQHHDNSFIHASFVKERDPTTLFSEHKSETSSLGFENAPTASNKPPHVLTTIDRYILVEGEAGRLHGLSIIDQRSAHQRILFEKLLSTTFHDREIQPLLIPLHLDLNHREADFMRQHLFTLNQMGFAIQEFGKSNFKIDAVPIAFSRLDVHSLLLEILAELKDTPPSKIVNQEKAKAIAMVASRLAVKKDQRLSQMEAQGLVNSLWQCEHPYQDPYGNPTVIYLSLEAIGKYFKRN